MRRRCGARWHRASATRQVRGRPRRGERDRCRHQRHLRKRARRFLRTAGRRTVGPRSLSTSSFRITWMVPSESVGTGGHARCTVVSSSHRRRSCRNGRSGVSHSPAHRPSSQDDFHESSYSTGPDSSPRPAGTCVHARKLACWGCRRSERGVRSGGACLSLAGEYPCHSRSFHGRA